MVKLMDLSNDHEKRRVREVIITGGDTIRVYEPSKSDIQRIIELQEAVVKDSKEGSKEDSVKVATSGYDTVRVLFPLLTDIEGIDEMTDEQVEYVIENPSLAFLQANHIIEGIVTDIWKMVILEARNRVLETDFKIESTKAMREINEKTLGLLEREGNGELITKLDDARKKYEEAKENESNSSEQEEVAEPVDNPTADKATIALEKYRKAFK